MKNILTILTLFISCVSFGQVTMRTPGTTTVTDGKLITVQSFAIPKTTLGGNLNGGIADSLGYLVLSKGDSSVYVYYKQNSWRKVGNDSAYIKARFDTSARTLTLYRINKDSTVLLIPAGSGSGSGATDYSWSVVGNTVSQLWNNGANHSFDKSDSRISGSDITNWNQKLNPSDTTGKWTPLTRTLTINGTTLDLSANRTWNVGTLVAADTIGKWVPLSRTLTINGITQDLSVNRTFTIPNTGVTSLAATSPITASASTGAVTVGMSNSGITAGTYPKATYNAFGLATSGSNLNLIDVTTGLGYTPYNPSAYPVNLGGETWQSVMNRGNSINTIATINSPGYLSLMNASKNFTLSNDGTTLTAYDAVNSMYLWRANKDSMSVNYRLYVNGPSPDTSLKFNVFGTARISSTAFLGNINTTGSIFFGIPSAGAGKVLTSDNTGFATWNGAVNSLNGSTGDLTLTGGTGIGISGTTISNTAGLNTTLGIGNTANNSIFLGATNSGTAYSIQLKRQVTNAITAGVVISNITGATAGMLLSSNDSTALTSTFIGLPANPANGPYYSPNTSTVYRLLHQNNTTAGTGISISNTTTGVSISSTAGLSTVLANGNTANNIIVLGSPTLGTQQRIEVDRQIGATSYALTGTVGTIGSLNGAIFRSDNATSSATTYLIAQPGQGWAQSTDGSTTSLLLNQGNVTGANGITIASTGTGISVTGNASSATYSPSITGTANLSGLSISNANYIRVGNIVHVSMYANVTVNSGGLTTITVGLPFTSTSSGSSAGSGLGVASSILAPINGVVAISASTMLLNVGTVTGTGATTIPIQISYVAQ